MKTIGIDTLKLEAPADSAGASGAPAPFSVWRIALSMPDATPSQLDSAIQANLPVRERFLSTRPDTLNLPGMRGRSLIPQLDSIQKCYTMGFFDGNPFLHPEIEAETPGYSGDPRPYELRNDEWITGTLLCSFIFLGFFVRYIWRFIVIRTKEFLNISASENSSVHEVRTSLENRYSLFMTAILSLMYALIFYGHSQNTLQVFLGQLSPHVLIGYYIICILFFFGTKNMLYKFVNCIFFDKEKRRKWENAYSYLIFAETVLLFPLLLILVYFNISDQKSFYIILFLFTFVKSLLLFKTFRILFNNLYCLFHFFVYFCALEIIPMVVIWTTLTRITNSLIVIF